MIIGYSLIVAIILFNIAMVVIALLRKRTKYLAKHSTAALMLLALFGALRIALPFSFPFTFVINSYGAIPWIASVLQMDILPGFVRLELQTALLLIWATGSVVMLIKFAHLFLKDNKRRTAYRRADNTFASMTALQLGLKRTKIIVSPDVSVPHVSGFLKAKIYLPEIELPPEMLELILRHEYQHFKSCDILIKAFYLLLTVAFWWNPIVHVFQRELDRLLEIRCDSAMTRRMAKDEKIKYLNLLVSILEYVRTRDSACLSNAATLIEANQSGFMEQRFRLIISSRASVGRQAVSIALVAILFLASFLIIIQPAYIPIEYDANGISEVNPGNSYIVLTTDGRYMFFVDGQFIFEIDESTLGIELYRNLPIIEESD